MQSRRVEGSMRVCFTVYVSPTKCRLTVEAETLTQVSRNSMVFIASSVNMPFSLKYVSKSATVSGVTLVGLARAPPRFRSTARSLPTKSYAVDRGKPLLVAMLLQSERPAW
ncbi:hypothetical protein PI124_g16464 [Phytophthora idaei]|nr:hypothetical protein PI124_g16464 [Phytophthora idaei]